MWRVRVIVVAVSGLMLVCAVPALAAFPGRNGMLAVQPRSGAGIVLVGADGRGVRRICTDRKRCGVPRRPRWSPDGRALVFAGPAIKIVGADGSCMNCQLGAGPNPAFEPNGALISFIQHGEAVTDAIDGIPPQFVVPQDGSDAVWSVRGVVATVHGGAIWAGRAFPARIASGSEPSWSPSGDAIAATQRGWIVVMRPRDHRVRRLVRGTAPAFSPDGRLIAYVAPDHRLMIVSRSGRLAPRRVGGIRAVSVDWQPRPRGRNPGCVPPPDSNVIADSGNAIVTSDQSSEAVAYMGCLRSDGRERLLDLIQNHGEYRQSSVGPVLAAPYVGLALTLLDTHYGNTTTTLQVFDLRSGELTKLGGESATCSDFCGTALDQVVLGRDGVSAAHVQTVLGIGSLATPIQQVACSPGGAVCVAADASRGLLSTTDPAAGARGWTAGTLSDAPSALSCPSADLCVGVGEQIDTSTNPRGGAATWFSTPFPQTALIGYALSCPSSTLCVASRLDGNVASSANPTGGAGAWTMAHIDTGASTAQNAVFCSTQPVCFISYDLEHVLTSTNPTSGAGAWTRSTRTPPFVSGACPSSTLCVAVTRVGIATTTDPVGESWTQTSVPGALDSITCPSTSLCVAVGSGGALEVSTNPTAGAWTHTTIDMGRQLTSIACPSTTLCVATDTTGHVVTSTDPTAGASAWTPALIDGDPCTDTTPCSQESIQVSDGNGLHTLDSSRIPGNGPFLTDLALTGDTLSWKRAGVAASAILARPR